jgi:epsilon-lactone hydrolase
MRAMRRDQTRRARILFTSALLVLLSATATPAVDSSGAISVPRIAVPFSALASEEARKQFVESVMHPSLPPAGGGVEATRRFYDEFNSRLVERMRKRYSVEIQPERIGGVVTDVVTPAQGIRAENKARVLINLHGGAFMWGAHSGGLVESIPIAAVGGIKVITIDYREAPEYQFPAASEDVAAVFRALIKTYKPRNIGIFGGSAGGILSAESVVWFRAHGLPDPGAIGTFCGSVVDLKGDSAYIAPALTAQPVADKPLSAMDLPYFKGADPNDPSVFPGASSTVLAQFPPTLLITGSRDFAMSSVLRSHALLVQANVAAELHVYEGMWHGFFVYPELPESIATYSVISRFFDRYLGR